MFGRVPGRVSRPLAAVLKRLSIINDGVCKECGWPSANGLFDREGLWCEEHGRFRAASHLERALFDVLTSYGWDEVNAVIEGVRAYDGTLTHLRTNKIGIELEKLDR